MILQDIEVGIDGLAPRVHSNESVYPRHEILEVRRPECCAVEAQEALGVPVTEETSAGSALM